MDADSSRFSTTYCVNWREMCAMKVCAHEMATENSVHVRFMELQKYE